MQLLDTRPPLFEESLKSARRLTSRWFIALLISMPALPLFSASLCVDHYPPYQVVTGINAASGYTVEFVGQVLQQLKEPLTIVVADTFDDCITQIRRGRVEMIAGIYSTPDRLRDMHLFKYSDGYSSTLFVTFDRQKNLTKFDDLTGKSIGVIKGVGYFPEFDQENARFKKIEMEHIGQLVFQLQRKEIDFIAISEHQWSEINGLLKDYQESIRIADYQVKNEQAVFLGVSKNARWKGDLSALSDVVRIMYQQHYFEQLILQISK